MSGYRGTPDSGDTVRVHVTFEPGSETDPDRHERLTRQLRSELAGLDVESVETAAAGTAPAGAKGDPVTIGALVVALSASNGVFTALIGAMRDWLNRGSGNGRIVVTIDGDTIEIERASAKQKAELMSAFMRRHSIT